MDIAGHSSRDGHGVAHAHSHGVAHADLPASGGAVAQAREGVPARGPAARSATVHPRHSRRGGSEVLPQHAGQLPPPVNQPTNGVQVIPVRIGSNYVTRGEMQQAIEGLRRLPAGDLALLAQYGVPIELHPVAALEGGLVGATRIVQRGNGPWIPVRIQVAVRHQLRGDRSIPEIVQHEVGHAISVIRYQDRSEAAAEAYARRY